MSAIRHLRGAAGLAVISVLAAACGGSGGGGRSSPPPPPAPTYSIGGAVSGLAGGGLTLRNNGGAPLAINANGAFAFSERVAAQSTYLVSVGSQPTSPPQICTVTNGSGTVQADVTNVAVTCATNAYTIGGTVSGLTGSGLVLHSNTGEDLPVAANGEFTFPTAIASGTGFTVTVGTQPTGPAQTCAVNAGTGTVGDANVTSIAVDCTVDQYTIGGSVSGLSGSGLVLNNGREQVTVDANGSFVFPTALLPGTSYDVSIDNAPSNPAQRCLVTDGVGTVAAANVADVAIACETHYPSFAYALNRADGTMASFAIDSATGQLRAGLVTRTGGGPAAAVTYKAADGRQFRYVVNEDDDTVSAFALGVRNGDAVEVSGSPYATGGTGPNAAFVHPTRPFLYVPNAGGSSIAAFSIDVASGALTPAGPAATGTQPESFVMEPSGRFAYVTASGAAELYTYAIDQSSGALTEVPDSRMSIGASNGGLIIERQGRFLYAFQPAAGTIAAFAIDPTSGEPAAITGSPFAAGPNATLAALHPNGRFIYVKHPASALSGQGLSVFTVDPATGALGNVQGSPFDSTSNPVTVKFDPTGRYLYAGHSASGPSFDLRAYAVNTATGALTPVPGSPFATPSSPTALNVDASGNYLYATHENSNQLSSYRIQSDTGALTALATSPASVGAMPGFIASDDQPTPLRFVSKAAYVIDDFFEKLHRLSVADDGMLSLLDALAIGSSPDNVALDPLGRFLYLPDPSLDVLAAFSVDAGTGALSGLPGSPYGSVDDPRAVTIDPQGRFAYVTSPSTGSIHRFVVDRASGALSPPASIAPGATRSVTVHPNGKYLYAPVLVNSGGMLSNSLQTFSIALDTGALTPTSSVGNIGESRSVVLDPGGRYAYVNDRDAPGVHAFSVDPLDGSLAPLSYTHIFSPYGMAMDPQGKFLFVTRRDHNTVEVFALQADGTLSQTGSFTVGGEPIAAVVDASGRWLYVTQLGGRSVVTFEIDRSSGALALKQITSTLWQLPFVTSPLTLSSYTR